MYRYFLPFLACFLACSSGPATPGVAERAKTDTAASRRNTVAEDSAPDSTTEFRDFRGYRLTDTIAVDLTGDGVADKAFLSRDRPRRLFITDGKEGTTMAVGSDSSFDGVADDLSWVDYWGLTRDTATYEVLVEEAEITGERTVRLAHPSLVFRKHEAGGGIVTWNKDRFRWVHQAD